MTSDEQMNTRLMTTADLREVMAIERASYPFPWTEGIFRDCLRIGYLCRVLINARDAVTGYGVLSHGAGEAHVLNICVAAAYRRRGLGEAILLQLIDDARQLCADTLLLEVRPSNTTAIELYRKLGFNEIGLRKNYYPAAHNAREDAIMFGLVL